MPTLFLSLMERIDSNIPFHGVCAPKHLFCRLHDRQDGKIWNVEATNGGNNMRDAWVIEKFGISQGSVDSGGYMRDLTKKEYLAELIGGLVTLYRQKELYEKAFELTDVMLALNPNSLIGLVHKGAISAWLGYNLQKELSLSGRPSKPEEEEKISLYRIDSEKYIRRAEMLGWRPETLESQERYLKAIKDTYH